MSPKLIKYMELTKLVREYSSNKTLIFVSKVAISVMNEVKKAYPNVDFMNQVDIAKELFMRTSKKYFNLISEIKPIIHIVI